MYHLHNNNAACMKTTLASVPKADLKKLHTQARNSRKTNLSLHYKMYIHIHIHIYIYTDCYY